MKNVQYTFIAMLIFFSLSLNSQSNKSRIKRVWVAINDDSLFYNSDTIEFFQKGKQFEDKPICNTIIWEIEKEKLKQYSNFKCSEPSRPKTINAKQIIKVRRKQQFDEILIRQGDRKDLYRILSYKSKDLANYPFKENSLKLLRKDKIQEERLYSTVLGLLNKRHTRGSSGEINALIVIDGIPLSTPELLKEYLLYDVKSIRELTKEHVREHLPHSKIDNIIILNLFR